MNIEELRIFCLSQKAVTEHFPFDDVTLVFKVMNKMFAIVGLDDWEKGNQKINLKCDPEKAVEYRANFEGINPGWHMNKTHWNTVTLNTSDVSSVFAKELIIHSYNLIVNSLPKKQQLELKSLS